VAYQQKDFRGRPLDEMMYVVKVNLYRRNPKVFQCAEVGIRVEELKRKIAQRQQEASRFTSETSKKALELRHHPEEEREGNEVECNYYKDGEKMKKSYGCQP
jgi:hypothetical protein